MTWRYLAVLSLLTGAIGAAKWGGERKPDTLEHPISSIPDHFGQWQRASESRFSEQVEGKLAATDYLYRVYRNGGTDLALLVSYYAEQKAGETMHSPQNCLPGAGWEAWDYGTAIVPVGNERIKVNRYGVQKNGERLQVLYWYQSRNRIVASEYAGKALLVWDSITRRDTGGALVRLSVPDTQHALNEEITLASALIPELRRCFGTTSPDN